MDPFFELLDVPTNSCVQLDTREEARAYPRGDIVLAVCRSCAFVRNTRFDQTLAEYSPRYEATQAFSPTFRAFHERLARDLIVRLGIRGKDVLEIGCGNGEFLALMCTLGANRGLGFDPSYEESRGVLQGLRGARVVRDFYSDAHPTVTADLVCSKMTLEHIADTGAFVRLCRAAMRKGEPSVLYLLVPNALRILRECAFEDIYYEHCSYFTRGSLSRLLEVEGLRVLRSAEEYSGQYISAEGSLSSQVPPNASNDDPVDSPPEIRGLTESFHERLAPKLGRWREYLDARRSAGVVLWGSGSKAAAFLAAVDAAGVIERVVDINPHKAGHFMPGSAQPIVSPAALAEEPPGAIIAMNRAYTAEIAGALASLGLDPELVAL
jgi:SAM-dependent methyltransferase